MNLTALELCAGGGGQALGLHMAGFECVAAVEVDPHCCNTLQLNRPSWRIVQKDIREIEPKNFRGVDLVAAGVPCPPFSIAGKQLGPEDDRDMFPAALRIVELANPPAVLLENVPGFAARKFETYRRKMLSTLDRLGYEAEWQILEAADFGVPQLRPRFVLVGLKPGHFKFFDWPRSLGNCRTMGPAVSDLMGARGWLGLQGWIQRADRIAPTLVGGSKKHGGPDLGPTRAKRQWREMGVDGMGIANDAPAADFDPTGLPRLTIQMVARIQSFPDDWKFTGGKTAAYRQVGNAFPPLVARAVGESIGNALHKRQFPMARHREEFIQMRLLERRRKYRRLPAKTAPGARGQTA